MNYKSVDEFINDLETLYIDCQYHIGRNEYTNKTVFTYPYFVGTELVFIWYCTIDYDTAIRIAVNNCTIKFKEDFESHNFDFEDKSEFFQYNIVNDYRGMSYEGYLRLKKLHEFMINKFRGFL